MSANYRVYDQTGGGETHDITAESLEDAIEQGREWIEDGDWSSEDGEYRTVDLPCSVREITMRTPRPDLDGTEESRVRDLLGLDCAPAEIRGVTYGEMDRGQLESLADYLDAHDDSVSDEDQELDSAIASQIREFLEEADEDITDDQDEHDCSGTYTDEAPECEVGGGDDDGGHDWQRPYRLVGGLKDNPGVWSTGGTGIECTTVCARCGQTRTESEPGCQRNANEPLRTVTIEEPTSGTKAWLVEHHEDDGWIPMWLAEYLDRPPTTRMTEDEAQEWVASHSDDDTLDDDDLVHAFAAIMGRRPTDKDRADGLWSLITA